MRIDEVRAVEGIKTYLRRVYDASGASGVLIGLSGGIDSTVLSALAVQSLGKGSVHLAYLYDQHSEQTLRRNARRISAWLGLELEEKSIEPAMRKMGVYDSIGMRMTSFSGLFNRMLHQTYRFIFRESPFLSSLRLGSAESLTKNLGSPGFRAIIRQPESGLNARHIYRRQVLEVKARELNLLLLGAANRSEWFVGWFVKDGIDDLTFQPLKGLYKTQIRQLAAFLDVPASVVEQAPSPDMMKGISDEFALGIRYSKIDLVLDHLEGGLSKESILAAGCTENQIRLVQEMKRRSEWKRAGTRAPPPVNGSLPGGLRL
ncbi:MAG: NAD(+) synthase [Anaerolineales bacterium]